MPFSDRSRTSNALVNAEEQTGTGDISSTVTGKLYPIDLANGVTGLSDNREFTFPSSPLDGALVGFFVSQQNAVDAGSSPFAQAPYYGVEPVTSTSINGSAYTANGAGGTAKWGLWLEGEILIFRWSSAAATWILEYDGRQKHFCRADHTAGSSWTGSTATFPSLVAQTDNASLLDTAASNDQIQIKRAGQYQLHVHTLSPAVSDQTYVQTSFKLDPNGADTAIASNRNTSSAASSNRPGIHHTNFYNASAADEVAVEWTHTDSSENFESAAANRPQFTVQELLV